MDEYGEPLSEATLRKYVQLGLLPRSRRVGQKGKHRGSRGIYPVEVIRRIDEIRRAMGQGETLETLARAAQAVRAKLSGVRVAMDEVLDAAETDLAGRDLPRNVRSELRATLRQLRKDGKGWLKSMEKATSAISKASADGVTVKANGASHKAATRAARVRTSR